MTNKHSYFELTSKPPSKKPSIKITTIKYYNFKNYIKYKPPAESDLNFDHGIEQKVL